MKRIKSYFLLVGLILIIQSAFAQPNDLCSNATILTPTNTCSSPVAGTTIGATESLAGCVGTADDDVWYQFVAQSTAHYITIANTGGDTDIVTEVFSGTCSALTSLKCQDTPDSPIEVTGLTIGNTYLFRIYTYFNTDDSQFTVCVTNPPPPISGKDCKGAVPLCCGQLVPAPTEGVGNYNEAVPNDCFASEHNSTWIAISITSAGTIGMNFDANPNADIDFTAWKVPGTATNPMTLAAACELLNSTGADGVIDRCDFNSSPTESGFGSGCGAGAGCDPDGSISVVPGDIIIAMIDDFSTFDNFAFTSNITYGGGAISACPPPVINVVNTQCSNDCGTGTGSSTGVGSITVSNCSAGSTQIEYATSLLGPWTIGTPTYALYTGASGASPMYIRCNNGAGDCPSQAAAIVTSPASCMSCVTCPAPTLSTPTQPTCSTATGSVTLSGLPTTGTWTINPGAISGTGTSTTISSLAPGTYSWTVTDAAGCVSVASATVTINAAPATPTAPIVGTSTQPTCSTATGSVALSGLPTTGTWTINPGAISSTGASTTIVGLAPGTYSWTVTDAAGCVSVASATVTINAAPATPTAPIVSTPTQPTCSTATGSVTLSGLPTTGTWTINPGAISGTGTSTTISSLAPGTYSWTVTDAAGCVSVASATVTINAAPATPTAPNVSTPTQPTCSVATGSVTLSDLPTTGTWTINPGAISGTGASTTIAGLAPGTYSWTVTDAAGCVSVASATVTINPVPATPTAPIVGTPTHPTCSTATGSVTLSGLPTTGTWTINPGAISGTGASTTIAGLAPGTYSWTVTNAAGCVSVASATVTINAQPATPTAPIVDVPTHPTCSTATGSVTLSGLPTTGTWAINPGAISGTGASTTIAGLAPGTYSWTVTDAAGCVSVASATVTINAQPATPTAPIVGVPTHPTCSAATGSVTLSGLPTTGTWAVNPGAISGTGASTTIVGLAPGTYSWTVTNAAGCVSVASATVTINPVPNPPAATSITICNGDSGALTSSGCGAGGTSTGIIQWYTTATGGSPIGTGSPFNPVGAPGSGLTNTNTPGTYTYYAACSGDATCRTAVNFVIMQAPPALTVTKTVGAIHYNQCANPDEMIVDYTIRVTNTTGQVLNNFYFNEVINAVPAGAFLGLATYPNGVNTNATVSPQFNYAWNGTTNSSLLTNNSSVLGVGQFVEVTLPLKFNGTLLNGATCIPNLTTAGGTYTGPTSACPVAVSDNACIEICYPTFTPPTDLTVNACTSYENELQHWLATYGGADFGTNCGDIEIVCNDYCAPHAWQYLDHCSQNAILPVSFTVKYTNGSSFTYCATIHRVDPQTVNFLELPQDLNLNCSSTNASAQVQAWLNNNGGAIGQLCNGYLFWSNNYGSGTPTACNGSGIPVTFTITNECGVTASATASIKLTDNTAPTFTSVPANVTVACDATAPAMGTAIATDGCSGVTVTFSDATTGSSCIGTTTTRTFTATDGCGNTATAIQSVTKAADTSAPTFTFVPANTTMNCGGTPVFGTATATDACSSVIVTFTDNNGSGSSCAGGSKVRTFTATDACGNTSTAQQTITPSGDSQPPVFAPVEEVIEIVCGDAVVFSTPSATDNCGSVTMTHTDEVTGDNCAGIMNIRKWTATDACGNTSTMKQTVWQIGDTTDPEYVNMIEDEAVYFCGETPNYDGVSAVDNCGGSVSVSYEIDYDYEDHCHDSYGYYSKVRYTAVDACGNENHETITSHFVPENQRMAFMYKPQDMTVACSDAYTFEAVHPKVVSYDGAISSVTFLDVANLTPCGSGTITRRWTATDVAGNSAIAEQTVTILPDTELPTITLANNTVLVDCAAAITTEQLTITDNCSSTAEITMTYHDVNVENTVQRTWTAEDACGNVANATQIYIILDTQAPVFAALQNKTISCEAPTVIFDQAIATDVCSAVTLSFTDTQSAISCGVAHTRTWKASDALGHVSTIAQTITVLDNTAPVFNFVPANAIVTSATEVNFGTLQVADNCQSVQLTYSDAQTAPICGNTGYTVTRTWVANDGCNNQAVATQQISVALDTQAPAFTSTPTDKSINLGEAIVFDVLTATDNAGNTNVTYTDVQGAPICGNSGYSVTRIWTATDDCNNHAIVSQVINVGLDLEAPAFAAPLQNKTITCGELLAFGSPTASDNSGEVVLTYLDAQSTPTCGNSGYAVTRTFTAADACNNAAQMAQTITISEDTEAPVFIGTISDLEMTQAAFNAWTPLAPAAFDNCQSVQVNVATPVKLEDCYYTVDYTATDACGNFVIHTQNIHITDNCIVLETEEGVLSSVSIYPNPVETELNIALSSEVNLDHVTAQIFDMLGKQVLMTQVVQHQSNINVASLAAGSYTLHLTTKGAVKTVKFVKM